MRSLMTAQTQTRTRPFLKWAGNKYRILDRILPLLPRGRRLIEPFAGSGAVFHNTDYGANLLSDANPDLIHLYQALQDDGPGLAASARRYFTAANNSPEAYYRLRERFNASHDPWRRSALFIYLNRHGYNGLCRYNASGEFNVPFGRYKRPYFPEAEMRAFSRKAASAVFINRPYAALLAQARKGDVVYCDPPYVPLSRTASFTAYSAGGFNHDEQLALVESAEALSARGVTVVISNHDTAFTREAYQRARLFRFQVRRSISCNGSQRGTAGEILAVFS